MYLHDVHKAAQKGDLRAMKKLVETDPTILNHNNYSDDWSPLMFACRHGHLEMVRYIIRSCPGSTKDRVQVRTTPLHVSSHRGHLNIVKYLSLVNPMWIHDTDSMQFLPIHLACLGGHLKVVQFLIEKFPQSWSKKTLYGLTPLDIAKQEENEPIIQYLEEQIATFTANDNDNYDNDDNSNCDNEEEEEGDDVSQHDDNEEEDDDNDVDVDVDDDINNDEQSDQEEEEQENEEEVKMEDNDQNKPDHDNDSHNGDEQLPDTEKYVNDKHADTEAIEKNGDEEQHDVNIDMARAVDTTGEEIGNNNESYSKKSKRKAKPNVENFPKKIKSEETSGINL